MTHGDENSVKCPHCKKPISKPLAGRGVSAGGITEFVMTCYQCKGKIHIWARKSIVVDAEKESKVL